MNPGECACGRPATRAFGSVLLAEDSAADLTYVRAVSLPCCRRGPCATAMADRMIDAFTAYYQRAPEAMSPPERIELSAVGEWMREHILALHESTDWAPMEWERLTIELEAKGDPHGQHGRG